MPRIVVRTGKQPPCGVRIRLALHGCTNRPFFRIVVATSRFKRDGRHLEQVGSIDPLPNYNNEKLVALNIDRIKYWLSVGAKPTKPVFNVLGLAGVLPVHPRSYLMAKRRRAEIAEGTKATTDMMEEMSEEASSNQDQTDTTDPNTE